MIHGVPCLDAEPVMGTKRYELPPPGSHAAMGGKRVIAVRLPRGSPC